MKKIVTLFSISIASLILLFLGNCANEEHVVVKTEFDFVLGLDHADLQGDYISPEWISMPEGNLDDVVHWGIFAHAPSQLTFKDVYVGENAVLDFSYAMMPGSWTDTLGDGVRFEVMAILPNQEILPLFSNYINPKINLNERCWHPKSIALDQIKNSTASFLFITHPGPDEDSANKDSDWSVWGAPILRSAGKSIPHKRSNETNVILVTIDTCRADYLGCYGNTWIETPIMDRLAEEGILFENLSAASSTTAPSHVSILTSLQPNQHGVINNGYKLPEVTPRLTQIMVERGYKTGAAISVQHLIDEVSGLGKWFDHFNHLSPQWLQTGQGIANSTRGGRATTSAAIEWLEEVHNDPYFLWIHYYDPHAPYFAEGELHQNYYKGDPRSTDHHSMDTAIFHSEKAEESLAWLRPYRDLDYFRKEYGAEISFVDAQIGRLLEALKRLKLDENTLIVITADHGENLGEHEIYFDHWTLFDTDIHVPLILWYPKSLPQGKRISTPVTHIDIAPTILDVVGERKNDIVQKMFDGISLRPYWKNEKTNLDRILTSDGLLYTEIAGWDDRYKIIWELRDAIYHEKLQLKMDRVWIYDRTIDPQESSPIACFSWGDETEQISFRNALREELLAMTDEKNLEGKQLERKILRIKERAGGKVLPTPEALQSLLVKGMGAVKLRDEYLQDQNFIPAILAILSQLKESVHPPKSLEERLKETIDFSILSDASLQSVPIYDDTLKAILEGLGYSGESH